jgi:8-oxo-dGTP diphosphatase
MKYVVGFMFDSAKEKVALIRKNRPTWQAGKLNGIGGKHEEGEFIHETMIREFYEETGHKTSVSEWEHFLLMGNRPHDAESWQVFCYVGTGDLSQLRTMEDEQIEIVDVSSINQQRKDLIDNLTWIVPLAINHLERKTPNFVIASY